MARRDRNASLAGLAALGALMYARSRRKEGETEKEEVKPIRTATAAPKDEGFKTLEDAPQSEKGAMPSAKAAPTASKPATPTAGAGRSAGIGGPTAAEMAQAAIGAGAGRSAGIGGPTAAEMARAPAPTVGAGGGRGGIGGPRIGEREAYEASRKSPAQIPVDPNLRGPAKQFSPAMEMSDTGRVLSTTAGALGGAGAGMSRGIASGPQVARTAIESAKGVTAPARYAAKEGLEVAAKSGPKAGYETAKSTLSGMQSRAQIQANRAAAQRAEAQAMEEAKPILQARPATVKESARTRKFDDDVFGTEFKKGGKTKKMASGGMAKSSVSKRADGIAKRGKTRGKMY